MAHFANKAYSNVEYNYTLFQAFEWYVDGNGKHWKTLSDKVPELADIGLTAFWVPPPTKASAGQGSVGYDIYDVYDLGEFDQKGTVPTRWGSKDELIDLIKKGKEYGIVTYVDAVLNHKFGADRTETFSVNDVDPNDRNRRIGGPHDITGWTGYDFPGRAGKYSTFKWNWHHFSGVDFDQKSGKSGIYEIAGKSWSKGVDTEHGNYDFLMGEDIDHSQPDVRADLKEWGRWIIDDLDAAGFRFDAVKHIDRGFISEFIQSVRANTKKPQLFAVGEFWKDELDTLEGYLEALHTQFSVFDTPLHYKFKEASDMGNSFDMRQIWDGTLLQRNPIDAVTVVDNHDTQIGQSLESWVGAWFKPLAYSLILLRPAGYPCVFWGDLYGTKGDNPQPAISQLGDIIRARKLFAYGDVRDVFDHPNCVGWVRTGDNKHDGCAVVMCNGGDGSKWLDVGQEHANEKWTDVLGWHPGVVTIGENGWAEFYCPARSVSIWVKEDARGRQEYKK